MRLTTALALLSGLWIANAQTLGADALKLGSAVTSPGSDAEVPLTLETGDEGVQALQAVFDWNAGSGTGKELRISQELLDALPATNFLQTIERKDWMALGIVVDLRDPSQVLGPSGKQDILLATVVIECGRIETQTPIVFRNGVHRVSESSEPLHNVVTVATTNIGAPEGLLLVNGSFRCASEAEVCDDTEDNDGDGDVDCDDSDCSGDSACREAFFRFGFEGPDVIRGSAGSVQTESFFCTLSHSGSGPGAQAWSVGVRADNALIADIGVEGTEAMGFLVGGFQHSETVAGNGAVSAVVLSIETPVSLLPRNDTLTVARLDVEAFTTRQPGQVELRYVNGLQGSGKRVVNEVVQNFTSLTPMLESKTIFVEATENSFIRGDTDGDGRIGITDAVRSLGFLFLRVDVDCVDSADANDSGRIEITDGVLILMFLFRGGVEPVAPFPACGDDPTPDSLGCEEAASGCLGPAQKSSGCCHFFGTNGGFGCTRLTDAQCRRAGGFWFPGRICVEGGCVRP